MDGVNRYPIKGEELRSMDDFFYHSCFFSIAIFPFCAILRLEATNTQPYKGTYKGNRRLIIERRDENDRNRME